MFIRKKRMGYETYYQVVEGYRDDGGRVRHRTLASLGTSPTIAAAIYNAKAGIRRASRRLGYLRRWNGDRPMADWGHARTEGERLQRQLTQRKAFVDRLEEIAERYGLPTTWRPGDDLLARDR